MKLDACGADLQVCAGRPRPARPEAGLEAGRRPGGLPHSNPTRRELLASAAVGSLAAQTPAPADRPNIVLIISDQFRWDCIGAMGLNPMNLTPNLDQMASRGVIFESAFASNPVCAPARGSIFTGQYPTRHGVW